MTVNELSEKLGKIKTELNITRSQRMAIVANDSIALVKSRVINTGKKADGSYYDDYSENTLPLFFFKGRGRSDVFDKFEKKAKKGYTPSYEHWREENHLQTSHKDFSFTGRMWQSVKPEIVINGETTIISISARDNENRKKLEWNSERDGKILELSRNEVNSIRKTFIHDINKIIDKHL